MTFSQDDRGLMVSTFFIFKFCFFFKSFFFYFVFVFFVKWLLLFCRLVLTQGRTCSVSAVLTCLRSWIAKEVFVNLWRFSFLFFSSCRDHGFSNNRLNINLESWLCAILILCILIVFNTNLLWTSMFYYLSISIHQLVLISKRC